MSILPTETERTQSDAITSFDREVEVVVCDLRLALAEVVEHLRPPVRRPADLRRRLGMGQKASWGLFTAATTHDPQSLPSLVPAQRGMERFLSAAGDNGVPQGSIRRAREAFERFEEVVMRHGPSRDAFEAMVADTRDGSDQFARLALKHKRMMFRGASLLWGRQARVCYTTRIMHPSIAVSGDDPASPGAPDPILLDTVVIRATIGLHRTRRGVPLYSVVHRWRWPDAGDPPPSPPEPLDPRETGPESVGLLRDFCSQPLLEFRHRRSDPGYRCHELVSDGLGAAAEVTFVLGEVFRADKVRLGSVAGSEWTLGKVVDIPTQMFIGDILMHKSICDTRPPEVGVYACTMDDPREIRDSDRLALTERAEYLGDGIGAARTPLVPGYADVLSYAMKRMGWNGDEFRVFRCCVEYPVLHTTILMIQR